MIKKFSYVFIALMFIFLMAIAVDFLRFYLSDDYQISNVDIFLNILGLVVFSFNIFVLKKLQEPWIGFGVVSLGILFLLTGIQCESLVEFWSIYGISSLIVISTMLFLSLIPNNYSKDDDTMKWEFKIFMDS